MSPPDEPRDLILVVADRNMGSAITGILSRPESLAVRPLSFDVRIHPQKDPGVLRHAHDFLRPFAAKYRHAMVLFDREGCGKEGATGAELESEVESRLVKNGWPDNAVAIALDPELENWVWSGSPEVDVALGWVSADPDLRTWLNSQGFAATSEGKPQRPKEAMEAALRHVRRPRSSAIYATLARRVSLHRCTDLAFRKLRCTLQVWFPSGSPT